MEQHNKAHSILAVLKCVILSSKLLTLSIALAIAGAVITALLPPLVLEKIINKLSGGLGIAFSMSLLYFALTALSCLFDALKDSLLTVFGQKITRGLRSEMCAKLSRMPASSFIDHEPGATVSRFVNDVDTVEALFTSGIISMFVDACKVISIFVIIFTKSMGLGILLFVITPLLFLFTRAVQKRMLRAQLLNRAAIAKVSNHVPETIRSIRMIHTNGKEGYMRNKYDQYIQESYRAVEKTNFYDSIYSPVVLIVNAAVIAVVMALSATGSANVQTLFGMSVGTAVAVIAYVGKVFGPLESIGMEIQTIQSAVAGVRRINEFLDTPERWETDSSVSLNDIILQNRPCVEFRNVCFGYEKDRLIQNGRSFTIDKGEQVTLTGRTGAGKSTIFKLLLGLYRPNSGNVLIYGAEAAKIPDAKKRKLFGYVEQSFRLVPGTVLEQITLFDKSISREKAEQAAKTVGLHETILNLKSGYDTACAASLFSQGQQQLLSIARAIAADPIILLFDEITANLDSETEKAVLDAIANASKSRTVLSISHRLYEKSGGRQISID